MKCVTIGCTKGGTGKTTIAINLSVALTIKGYKVLLVDADEQRSALSWRGLRQDASISAISLTQPTIHQDINNIGDNFDIVIIDVGGSDSNVLRSAITAAHLLLIPFKAGQFDVWAVGDTLKILKEAESFGIKPKAKIILNQVTPNTVMFREAMKVITDLPVSGMDAYICNRQAFIKSALTGKSVVELEPSSKAALEINNLAEEILTMLDLDEKEGKE